MGCARKHPQSDELEKLQAQNEVDEEAFFLADDGDSDDDSDSGEFFLNEPIEWNFVNPAFGLNVAQGDQLQIFLDEYVNPAFLLEGDLNDFSSSSSSSDVTFGETSSTATFIEILDPEDLDVEVAVAEEQLTAADENETPKGEASKFVASKGEATEDKALENEASEDTSSYGELSENETPESEASDDNPSEEETSQMSVRQEPANELNALMVYRLAIYFVYAVAGFFSFVKNFFGRFRD